MMAMAMVSSSSSTTRIPIKLAPQLFHHNDKASTYHALQHASAGGRLQLGGATLRASSGNNGSTTPTISLAAADGAKLGGSMTAADEHDYVLLYDDASRSYILHKVSTVSHLLPSASGTSTTTTTPSSRPKTDNSTGSTYSPSLARTPQSANSPSLASSFHNPLSKGRDTSKTAYTSPVIGATGSGTAKKRASQIQKNNYDSSPTPSVDGGTPASYGLGISTAAARPSPSLKGAGASTFNKGKATIRDVEEFDMGSNSGDELHSNALQLPPAQAPAQTAAASTSDRQTARGPQQYPDQRQPSHHSPAQAAKSTSTSLSHLLNQDVVMSEISSEDEGDFDDLANDLESSLAGQGPFARANLGTGFGGIDHNVISSDEDEDSDFVNALSEQMKPMISPQKQQRPPQQLPQHVIRAQQDQPQPQPQRQAVAPPQPSTRPAQAGKKLPTAPPRKYDSDIASSSESDDDSD